MSPAPRVILLDSNAYFRLALSVHPLLAELFGAPPPYALKVLEDLDREFSRSRRLKSKFNWVANSEYRKDRASAKYSPRGKTATEVEKVLSYLIKYAHDNQIDISYEDLKALAVGHARSFPVITDDKGMQEIAEVFAIEYWTTLELLKLMLDCDRIDLAKIHEAVEYWNAENDLPNSPYEFKQIYREIFNEDCPV